MSKDKDMAKISIRLDQEVKEQLDLLSRINSDLNRSDIVREAIRLWLNIRINKISYAPADLSIISKNLLRIAFDSMSTPEIKLMAKTAFLNSEKWKDANFEVFPEAKLIFKFKALETTLEGYLESLVTYVYGPKAYKWFDSISYEIQDEMIKISGIHTLGQRFNLFIKFHLKFHLEKFGYYVSRVQSLNSEENELIQSKLTVFLTKIKMNNEYLQGGLKKWKKKNI